MARRIPKEINATSEDHQRVFIQSINDEWALKNAGFGDGRIMCGQSLDFVSRRRFYPATREMIPVYCAAYCNGKFTFSYCGFTAEEVVERLAERISDLKMMD